MIHVLIGHRGVGKTRLLERIRSYLGHQNVLIFDLDQVIAENEGHSVSELFDQFGEEHFRDLERRYLNQLVSQHNTQNVYIALGAGFLGPLPAGVKCLWVRRETDSAGRIFLNRPRLNSKVSPLEEYLERYAERNDRYRQWADEELTLLEGFTEPFEAEQEYFENTPAECGGVLTLHSGVSNLKSFIERRLAWGVRYIELRDDLLSSAEMRQALDIIPADRVLVAIRKNPGLRPDVALWDWPLELGGYTGRVPPPITSLHERMQGESLSQCLQRLGTLGQGSAILKAAPEVFSFEELWLGHAWVSEDPKRRAFLPRSQDGRFRWYRLWMKNRMALNFWREGDGSSSDQPLLLEWLAYDFTTRWFAAILGDPVNHSWTPAFQSGFFAERGLPVLRIPISQEQWEQGALPVLEKLGLRYAAVTSPLKELAYKACLAVTENARKFQAVNTLRWTPEGWNGTNTDEMGLRYLEQALQDKKVAVWGGGGTLGALHSVFPHAQFYSARSGQLREGEQGRVSPDIVIWAIGRGHMPTSQWPPLDWQPQLVIDLNYSENSPGREYALKVGCPYQSGAEMFYAQGKEQQLFWK